jgi:hypothetical protein
MKSKTIEFDGIEKSSIDHKEMINELIKKIASNRCD